MRYVDAGYAIALATLFAYAISLVVRRRRWARALKASGRPVTGDAPLRGRGERS